MIQTEGLTKLYGDTVALDHLTIRVDPGEVLALVGGNGAGKTTVISLLLNFVTPTSGRATVCGLDVTADSLAVRRQLAFLPEGAALYDNLTARQNVELFARLGGRRDIAREECDMAMRRSGLPEAAFGAKASTFTDSMQQRLALAVVLVRDTPVVLMDEPMGGLDPRAAEDLSLLIRELRAEGRAVLICTHDLFRASDLADRIGVMKEGRMVLTRSAAELQQDGLRQVYLDYMRS